MVYLFLVIFTQLITSQDAAYIPEERTLQIRTIAFYNLENLYDTIDDPNTEDQDRTPGGRYAWGRERYTNKIHALAKTISEIGKKTTGRPPHLLGICETENQTVLEDLISCPPLSAINYGIIHLDSPDERGIDVALLYDQSVFSPLAFRQHQLLIYNENEFRDRTRNQLVVYGYLDQEPFHIFINHWPSRSGGTARSEHYRKAAARLTVKLIDSVRREHSLTRMVIMGDFNDNPTDYSMAKILKGMSKKSDLEPEDFYNPMFKMFLRGYGTLAYRDHWNLFDQILISANLLQGNATTYQFLRAGIHNPEYLITRKGRYRGYPFRTYAGGRYTGGYSDHFPVYIYLGRKLSRE